MASAFYTFLILLLGLSVKKQFGHEHVLVFPRRRERITHRQATSLRTVSKIKEKHKEVSSRYGVMHYTRCFWVQRWQINSPHHIWYQNCEPTRLSLSNKSNLSFFDVDHFHHVYHSNSCFLGCNVLESRIWSWVSFSRVCQGMRVWKSNFPAPSRPAGKTFFIACLL